MKRWFDRAVEKMDDRKIISFLKKQDRFSHIINKLSAHLNELLKYQEILENRLNELKESMLLEENDHRKRLIELEITKITLQIESIEKKISNEIERELETLHSLSVDTYRIESILKGRERLDIRERDSLKSAIRRVA